MSKTFHVEFDVPQDELPVVLQVITKTISNLVVKSNDTGSNSTMRVKRNQLKRSSPMTDAIVTWVKEMREGNEFTTGDVKAFLTNAGFKDSNSSPLMSYLTRNTALVVSPHKGFYRRAMGA
jgi:hypothetical protein